MALLHPEKVGIAAWDEFTTLNGQPATGDPKNPTTSQATLDGINAIGFPWYHTWHDTGLTGNQGRIRWIPAWNTIAEVNSASLARFKATGELVIASSEPWNSFGGTYPTISPDECIAIWPQLMALGNRLTSPSISGPTDGNDWLADFMGKITAHGYRVDVINVHYYSTDGNITNFRNYLQDVYNLYRRPLFIGEWARYVNWGIQDTQQVSYADQAAFAVAATQMMDSLDFVEKQAWYAAGTGGGGVLYLGSEVLYPDGSISPVGQAFKQMLAPSLPSVARLLNPGKVGVYAETQGDRDTHNFAPGVMLRGLNDIGLRWYYTYANRSPNSFEATLDNSGTLSNPNSVQTSIIQLPSIYNADPTYQNATTLNFAKVNGGLIVTYNEPWNSFNNWWPGNPATPTQALDGWPALMALGNRLASPSISFSSFTQSNDWLAQFMAGVASRGYRVDVINVHFYSSTPGSAVADFQSYLQSIHNLYNKPIIVSEWALADWGNQNGSATATFSPSQQADFAEAACAMLDGLSFVEWHAWFNSAEGVGYTWQNSGLLNADGTPTLVGQRFAQMLGGSASGSTTQLVAEFYKNGILVGIATKLPSGALYPILSLANNTEVATANFGATPMAFLPNGVSSWDGSQTGTGVGTGGTTSGTALSTTDKASSVVLSNSNLTATQSGSSSGMVRGVQSGVADRYFEVKFGTIAAGAGAPGIGVANATQALTNSYPGNPNGVGWFSSGYTEWPQSGTAYNFGNFATGDVLGVLLKASSVNFYRNGILVGTATLLPSGQLYPIISLANDTDSATVNFGATPLQYLPAGTASWDGSQTGVSVMSSVTLNPVDKGTDLALSNGNLTVAATGPFNEERVRATRPGTAGNYFELHIDLLVDVSFGVSTSAGSNMTYEDGTTGIVMWQNGWVNGSSGWIQGVSFATGDTLGVKVTGTAVNFYKNGSLSLSYPNTINPAILYPQITLGGTSKVTVNFGATPLSFLPAGSASWDGSQTRAGGAAVGGFVCDGDSLTRGAAQDGNPVTPYPTQLAGLTSKPVINLGIDGQSMFTMDANYATNVAPRFNASTANVLILEGGGNDIPGGGTATSIGASVRSYCAKARATGFKVYLMTMPPIGLGDQSVELAINADRRATWQTYCDGLIDIAANPAFSDPTNHTYFQADNVHWTTAADTIVANMVKTATLG
jgi:hypothetical protein